MNQERNVRINTDIIPKTEIEKSFRSQERKWNHIRNEQKERPWEASQTQLWTHSSVGFGEAVISLPKQRETPFVLLHYSEGRGCALSWERAYQLKISYPRGLRSGSIPRSRSLNLACHSPWGTTDKNWRSWHCQAKVTHSKKLDQAMNSMSRWPSLPSTAGKGSHLLKIYLKIYSTDPRVSGGVKFWNHLPIVH